MRLLLGFTGRWLGDGQGWRLVTAQTRRGQGRFCTSIIVHPTLIALLTILTCRWPLERAPVVPVAPAFPADSFTTPPHIYPSRRLQYIIATQHGPVNALVAARHCRTGLDRAYARSDVL
jgi:hypothetical protein